MIRSTPDICRQSKMIHRYYRVDRRSICLLRFILEGYDGLAVLTTLDAREGIVVLRIAPGCEEDVDRLLCELKKDVLIEPVRNDIPETTKGSGVRQG